MSYGYGGGGGGRRGKRGGRGNRDGSRERWDRGGGSRGHCSDTDPDRGGRHPSHLKGREIGLWYAKYGAVRKKQADRRSVGAVCWNGILINVIFNKAECLVGVSRQKKR